MELLTLLWIVQNRVMKSLDHALSQLNGNESGYTNNPSKCIHLLRHLHCLGSGSILRLHDLAVKRLSNSIIVNLPVNFPNLILKEVL